MSKQGFVDADGDFYTVERGDSGHNILLTYKNGEESGVDLFIFKVEDAARLAAMILEAAQEAGK